MKKSVEENEKKKGITIPEINKSKTLISNQWNVTLEGALGYLIVSKAATTHFGWDALFCRIAITPTICIFTGATAAVAQHSRTPVSCGIHSEYYPRSAASRNLAYSPLLNINRFSQILFTHKCPSTPTAHKHLQMPGKGGFDLLE